MDMYATRTAYGEELVKLGKDNKNIVALDADLAVATMSFLFRDAYPDRFFDVGISEAEMLCAAAGLASSGKIPFASTMAVFAAGRAFEQIRNSICYPHLNVKIVGTHGGLVVGADGATHQAFEDISLMKVLPGMVVLCPADAVEARQMVKYCVDYEGPVYLRLGRNPTPVIFGEDYQFVPGKGVKIREGSDVTIVSTGTVLQNCIDAADMLEKEGIRAEIIHIGSIKPIDAELLAESAAKTGKVVTVEDASVINGLGASVAQCLAERAPARMRFVGIPDTYGESGEAEELLKKYGIDAGAIAEHVRKIMK